METTRVLGGKWYSHSGNVQCSILLSFRIYGLGSKIRDRQPKKILRAGLFQMRRDSVRLRRDLARPDSFSGLAVKPVHDGAKAAVTVES